MRVIVDADSVEAGVLAARDEVGDFGDRQAHRDADIDLHGGAADEYLALAREGVLNGPVELRGLHGLEEPVPDAEVPAALAVLFRQPPAGHEDHGDVRVHRAHALGGPERPHDLRDRLGADGKGPRALPEPRRPALALQAREALGALPDRSGRPRALAPDTRLQPPMQVDIRVPAGLPIPDGADFLARCADA